jgi:putative spermidine/putrescine transport system permease protein
MSTANRLERRYGPVVRLLGLFGWAFLLLPVIFVVAYSFNSSSYFILPPKGLTLDWYAKFFASDRFMAAARNSLIVTGIVTPTCVLAAVPTAYVLVRFRFRGKALFSNLLLSPLIVPGVVTGISLLSLFAATNRDFGIFKLIVGMFIFGLPFAVRALVANLIGLDERVEEAARNVGATAVQTFFYVTLPQLKPGILAASTFVFVEAIDNFSIAVFLTENQTVVLPVEAYQYIRDFDDPTVAAMASVLIVLSVLLVSILEKVIGFEKAMRV